MNIEKYFLEIYILISRREAEVEKAKGCDLNQRRFSRATPA